MTWKPVKTAPKDGTEVLLSNDSSGLSIGYWDSGEEDAVDQPGHDAGWYGVGIAADPIMYGRTSSSEFGFISNLYEETGQPTHWMELPSLPRYMNAGRDQREAVLFRPEKTPEETQIYLLDRQIGEWEDYIETPNDLHLGCNISKKTFDEFKAAVIKDLESQKSKLQGED